MRPWQWAMSTIIAFALLIVLLLLLFPSLRYVFISVLGPTDAPSLIVPVAFVCCRKAFQHGEAA